MGDKKILQKVESSARVAVATGIPFFRPIVTETEIAEVVATLRSGWLTSGPRVREFELAFASTIGARHAIAVNSGTAALHLGVVASGVEAGEGVLVPTMTFAACAEVVQHAGAIPILVDCDPVTLNLDFADAAAKTSDAQRGNLGPMIPAVSVTGVMPVHVGGLPVPRGDMATFLQGQRLWVVEDCAHAFPAGWSDRASGDLEYCGGQAQVACFSFYANKTITTGEGGMVVTRDVELANRMRRMALHGLDQGTWDRQAESCPWDYQIVDRGFKYNMSDVAAAIGIHQLARAEQMRLQREQVAYRYLDAWRTLDEIGLPFDPEDRLHSWHLFCIRLNLNALSITRNEFCQRLKAAGVGFSVHWRPLHLHPLYQKRYGWTPDQCPVATRVWETLISLPIYPGMRESELSYVIKVVNDLCHRYRRRKKS